MNMAVRRLCQNTPIVRDIYRTTRRAYHRRRVGKAALKYFVNVADYCDALKTNDGRIVEIHTIDGLRFAIRRNCMDAMILAEIFLDKSYVHGLPLSDRPVIIDIGGYIGDFTVYAARCLNARKVVVCEPSPRNWALLQENVANNCLDDRVILVNKAVTDGKDVMMNVDAPDSGQARVSAYHPTSDGRRLVPVITLSSLIQQHQLGVIDLLKIDCEGGEYDILLSTPSHVFSSIRNIVFEYHEITGFEAKLAAVKRRLSAEGYFVVARGALIFATREQRSSN